MAKVYNIISPVSSGISPCCFFCDPCAHVEKKIIRDGLYDVHILNYMVQFVSPNAIVLDVGSNIGAYPIPFTKALPHMKVHAFEPNLRALDRLNAILP